MKADDQELVAQAKIGDSAAFHELVDRYAMDLYRFAYSLTGQAADAEDMVQETLTAAIQGIRKFEGRSSLKTWLFRILSNQTASYHRKRNVRRAISLDGSQSGTGIPLYGMQGGDGNLGNGKNGGGTSKLQTTSTAVQMDTQMDVNAMLAKLSADHRQVFILREMEGFTYQEIADTLELPRGTVESRIHRARKELRKLLTGYRPDD